jgi:hypothetical protein
LGRRIDTHKTVVTPGYRGDRLKKIILIGKGTDIWHLVLLGKRSCSRSRHLVL